MKRDPKGFSREPSSRQAGESCTAERESAKETLRVWILDGNRELIRIYEGKVKKVIARAWES